jgi:hypothetical protein
MPQQRLPSHQYPYTQVLSALRKNDLIRLCVEFGLPVDGPVVGLRNRLKDYLNLHRDTLYRDPRYKALFPKHRKPNHPPSPSIPPSTVSSRSPTPDLPDRSPSPAESFASWHGIGGDSDNHADNRQRSPVDPVPQDVRDLSEPHYFPPPPSPPPFPQDRADHQLLHSHSLPIPGPGPVFPAAYPGDRRKYFHIIFLHSRFGHYAVLVFRTCWHYCLTRIVTLSCIIIIWALCSPVVHYAVHVIDTMQSYA